LQFFQIFQSKWGDTYHGTTIISLDQIKKAEAELNFHFPQIYFDCITKIGIFDTAMDLLDQIVDQKLHIHDLAEMAHPKDIPEDMQGWQEAGMPEGLIPFAKDCMGNAFCFAQEEAGGQRKNDLSVYFFDHDLDEVELEANSFVAWIESFNAVVPTKQEV
jgi:hypothetical protein